MSNASGVIIRLQNLPLEAASADVREFFRGLGIPDGGVHIVGGKDGDAFIAFSTDEDARQAMRLDGKRIKNSRIKLFLSSRVEMQQLIEKARMEFQGGGHHPATTDKERSGGKRRRSRSRSPERRRRSRSRSPNRNVSRGSGIQHPRSDNHPPYRGPAAPISGFSSFRNEPEPGPRMNGPPGPFDRTSNPNIDHPFLERPMDRSSRPQSLNYPPRHGEISPKGESASPRFGVHHFDNAPPFIRPRANMGERFGGDGKIVRPLGQPSAPPFHPTGPSKFNEPPGFMAPGMRPRMEPRPDIGGLMDRPPPPPPDRPGAIAEPASPFIDNGVQQVVAPLAAPTGRSSRRALLPMPEEPSAEPSQNFPVDGNVDLPGLELISRQPVTLDYQRPPQDVFANRFPPPFIDQRMPNDWMMEGGVPQQQPLGFPFGPPLLDRPSLFDPGAIVKKKVDLCVSMTAVPPSLLRYGAIRRFFNPLDLEGPDKIKIIVDDQGERTGQAYCKFSTPEDVETALGYSGTDKIFIRTCSDAEFDNAVDGGLGRRSSDRDSSESFNRSRLRDNPRHLSTSAAGDTRDGKDAGHVVEISNIPYKAEQADLKFFLSHFNPVEIRRLYKHHHHNGKIVTSDTAFAIFSNEADMMTALRSAERRILERNVRMAQSSVRTMENAFANAPPPPPEAIEEWKVREKSRDANRFDRSERTLPESSPPDLPYPRPTSPYRRPSSLLKTLEKRDPVSDTVQFPFTCICMRGIPMNSSNRDVGSFFTGLAIAPNGIRILKSTPGVACVEFASASDCERASKKDRSYMGTQMVTLKACTKEEMMDAVNKQFGANGNGGSSPLSTQTTNAGGSVGLLGAAPPPPVQPQHPLGGELIQSQDRFGTLDPLQQAAGLDATQTRWLYVQQLAALAKQEEENNAMAANSQLQIDLGEVTSTNGSALSTTSSDMPPIDPEVVSTIGGPGCVAALHNLPPHITLEEICEFFQGYQLIDDSIRMHYSNSGEPTGDCLLAFATAADAHAAVTSLNGTMLSGQQIKMYVVPAGK